jgi:hypothetical protein
MLQDLILGYSSRRSLFKLIAVLAGMALLAIGVVEKMVEVKSFLWMAAPLLLLGLVEAGLAAEQRRCCELSKEHGDISVPPAEGVGACLLRYGFAVISFSIWPFYLILFGLIWLGGGEIAKANREARQEQAAANASATPALPPYYQPGRMPLPSNRPMNGSMPLNQQPSQRFTPPSFPTPPRVTVPNRPPVTPAKSPVFFPPVSPAPPVKNP